MVAEIIAGTLHNFSLVMLIAGIVVGIFAYYAQRHTNGLSLVEQLFRFTALLGVGAPGLMTFVMHVFFAESTAEHIGWKTSPFQYEVGMADLTVGVLGVLAFFPSLGFRLATAVATVTWLGGDAIGHIREMIVAHNYAPGNAGSWFWTDVIVPVLISTLAYLLWREKRAGTSHAHSPFAGAARQTSF
jgi:hypothetical protein